MDFRTKYELKIAATLIQMFYLYFEKLEKHQIKIPKYDVRLQSVCP